MRLCFLVSTPQRTHTLALNPYTLSKAIGGQFLCPKDRKHMTLVAWKTYKRTHLCFLCKNTKSQESFLYAHMKHARKHQATFSRNRKYFPLINKVCCYFSYWKTVFWSDGPGHMMMWGSGTPQVLNLCWSQVALWLYTDSSPQYRTLQSCGLNA